MRTEEEIDEVLNQAQEHTAHNVNKWPGMTYAQGVAEALMWVKGDSDDNPMAD